MSEHRVITGDCLDVMRGMDADLVDSVVTDPPYGLKFMGKGWDHAVPGVDYWAEALRVAKPGAHLLAFGGTRLFHRLACAVEDAGWEIRDCVMWVYGSGFPKSHDVSKAIDKAAGAERQVVGVRASFRPQANATRDPDGFQDRSNGAITAPATDDAKCWQGWGTALKPAWEPVIVARKPPAGTVAQNVLEHGTGALNIDGCRVKGVPPSVPQPIGGTGTVYGFKNGAGRSGEMSSAPGRWPANLIHDGSEEVVGLFPESRDGVAVNRNRGSTRPQTVAGVPRKIGSKADVGYGGSGSAARFFYCPKASKRDRNEGLEDMPVGVGGGLNATVAGDSRTGRVTRQQNTHPTVKPTELMAYLCRLVTPPGGLVLDPFCGSGSTGKAAVREGFRFVGIEKDEAHARIATRRVEAALA